MKLSVKPVAVSKEEKIPLVRYLTRSIAVVRCSFSLFSSLSGLNSVYQREREREMMKDLLKKYRF